MQRKFYMEIFESTIRLVKHAGHVLVITGILLLYSGGWSWHEPWIVMTLVVMLSSIFFLAGAFKYTLKKMHEGGCDHSLLIKKLQHSILIYIGLLMIMLWFMVVKPRLW
ncbi:Uncharacterised protein [Bacillus freudenreichii]|nr:Uncharacterised protein [Bacillus freudenreichii]